MVEGATYYGNGEVQKGKRGWSPETDGVEVTFPFDSKHSNIIRFSRFLRSIVFGGDVDI